MKIKGVAKITLRYDDGREEVFSDNECNDICWLAFRRFFISSSQQSIPTKRDTVTANSGSSARWKLFYGATDIKQTPLNAWYNPDGIVNANTDYPTYTPGILETDPDIIQLSATIAAPVGSPRTIKVIGIDISTSGGYLNPSNYTGSHLTILSLNTPCIQQTNVTVVISYDIYLYPTQPVFDSRISDSHYDNLKAILRASCDAVNSVELNFNSVTNVLLSSSYGLDGLSNLGISGAPTGGTNITSELTDSGITNNLNTLEITANAFRQGATYPTNSVPANGTFVKNQVLIGPGLAGTLIDQNNAAFLYASALPPGPLNPVQNVYGQRNNPPGPSQDLVVNNTATMTGSPVFNISNWTDPKLQKLIRINITGSGTNTTATYKLSVMNFIAGFAGNTWMPRTALLPQPLNDKGYFRKDPMDAIYEDLTSIRSGGITYRSPDDYKYVLAVNCQRVKSGVSIYDVIEGARYCFNSGNGLNVTAVSDGECTPNFYFVCCANTGLWRISLDRTTIEHITSPTGTDKAYQICKKNDAGNTLWVLFDGGLCKLSNPEAALGSLTWSVHNESVGTPTFTYPGVTNSNWSNVTSMIIDPDNLAVDQFLFVTGALTGGDTSGSYRKGFVWWDTTTGSAVNPGTGGIAYQLTGGWSFNKLLAKSDEIRCSDGIWSASGATTDVSIATVHKFTYGASNLGALYYTSRTGDRHIPATVNNIKGLISSYSANSGQNLPGWFIPNSVFSTIPNGVTLSATSPYVDFSLKTGANSYTGTMESYQSANAGAGYSPLIYLKNSNLYLSLELAAQAYGVTPIVLGPSHSKYATYKGAFWKEYGWDGAAWVLGDNGSKVLHTGNEFIPALDNLGIAFLNGLTGTSFVVNEWFSFVVGAGVFKDNGVTFTSNFSFSLDPTKTIPITDSVPLTPLGSLTDEPLTFSLRTPTRSSVGINSSNGVETYCIQNKGIVITRSLTTGANSAIVSDQLIPASTPFVLKFKWLSFQIVSGGQSVIFGTATGTGNYTYGICLKYNVTSGVLGVYNDNTLLATINNPSLEDEFRIERDVSNNVTVYQNATSLITPVVISSQFVILADSNGTSLGGGWYDMKLTYTENRRVLRLGASLDSSGSFSSKFSALTYNGLCNDVKVLIGSGSPLEAALDYTSSGSPVPSTGTVKVCPGAGWLVFHDSEPANPISGSAVAHFVLNNQ